MPQTPKLAAHSSQKQLSRQAAHRFSIASHAVSDEIAKSVDKSSDHQLGRSIVNKSETSSPPVAVSDLPKAQQSRAMVQNASTSVRSTGERNRDNSNQALFTALPDVSASKQEGEKASASGEKASATAGKGRSRQASTVPTATAHEAAEAQAPASDNIKATYSTAASNQPPASDTLTAKPRKRHEGGAATSAAVNTQTGQPDDSSAVAKAMAAAHRGKEEDAWQPNEDEHQGELPGGLSPAEKKRQKNRNKKQRAKAKKDQMKGQAADSADAEQTGEAAFVPVHACTQN